MTEIIVTCTTGARLPVGGWSSGSLRLHDVMITTLKVYEAVDPAGSLMLQFEEHDLLKVFIAVGVGEHEPTEDEVEALESLCMEIAERIDAVLPYGWAYGGHQDDPACIGIWQASTMRTTRGNG